MIRRLNQIKNELSRLYERKNTIFNKNEFLSRNDEVLLVANGPSLRDFNFDILRAMPAFAANKIYLLYNNFKWRPDIIFVEDPLVAEQNKKYLNKLEQKLFVRKDLSDLICNKNIYEFNSILEYFGTPRFSFDASRRVYWASSVVYVMLQFAFFFGFKRINIIGLDFSFDTTNLQLFKKTYKQNEKQNYYTSKGEVNHFSENYRSPGEKWNFPNLDIQKKGFDLVARIANDFGVEIVNYTPQTQLTSFEVGDPSKLYFYEH